MTSPFALPVLLPRLPTLRRDMQNPIETTTSGDPEEGAEASPWVLATAAWNDAGTWNDNAPWKDS